MYARKKVKFCVVAIVVWFFYCKKRMYEREREEEIAIPNNSRNIYLLFGSRFSQTTLPSGPTYTQYKL